MLTDAQRYAYDRDGFIVVPDVFSAEDIAELPAPREVAGILVGHRAELRRCYRDTLATLSPSAFEQPPMRDSP